MIVNACDKTLAEKLNLESMRLIFFVVALNSISLLASQ